MVPLCFFPKAGAKVGLFFVCPNIFPHFLPFTPQKTSSFLQKAPFSTKKHVFSCVFLLFAVPLSPQSESSAVSSALRSGRRGRAFESPLSDTRRQLKQFSCRFFLSYSFTLIPFCPLTHQRMGSSMAANPPLRTRRKDSVLAEDRPSTVCFR